MFYCDTNIAFFSNNTIHLFELQKKKKQLHDCNIILPFVLFIPTKSRTQGQTDECVTTMCVVYFR